MQGPSSPLKLTGERSWELWLSEILAGVCVASACCVGLQVTSEIRAALVLIGLTLGTGRAITGWVDIDGVAYAVTVAVCAGVGLLIVSGMVFVEARWWHPVVISVVLLLLGAAGNLAQSIWKVLGTR